MKRMGKKLLCKSVWMMGIPVLAILLLHPCTVLAKASVFRGGDIAYKDLAELALGGGMTEMLRETKKTVKYTIFSTTNYGNTKMNTIADTEITGYGEVIGAGRRFLIGKGKMLSGGIYYERSRSESDSWTNNGKTKGKGIQNGGGIMGRLDVKSGNYYEWLLHIGRANNRVNSAALKYEADPSYIGAVMTFGHRFTVGEGQYLSPYFTYFYNRTQRKNLQLTNFDLDIEDVKSHKTKLGVQYTRELKRGKTVIRPYAGLSWNHEFDGKAAIHIKGVPDPEFPDIRGDTVSSELGCKWEIKNWNIGLGVEGFLGKREGWNTTLAIVCTL